MSEIFKPGDRVIIKESETAMPRIMAARIGEEVTIKSRVTIKDYIHGDSFGYLINEVNPGEMRCSPLGFIWPEDALELVTEESYSNAELDDFFELNQADWENKYKDSMKWERMRDYMRANFKESFFNKVLTK